MSSILSAVILTYWPSVVTLDIAVEESWKIPYQRAILISGMIKATPSFPGIASTGDTGDTKALPGERSQQF